MNYSFVAVAPPDWMIWADRLLIVSLSAVGLVFLPSGVRETIRVARWVRAGVGWPGRLPAALLTLGILLSLIGLGTLFLALDLPSRHPGSFFVQIGLMNFVRPLRGLWDQTQPPPLKRGPAWLTENKLEMAGGIFLLLMGISNCFAPG